VLPVNAELTLDGSGSSGEGATINAWHWDFGDGRTATGQNVVHRYEQPGKYTIKLTVRTDEQGPWGSADHEKRIVVNQAPVAVAGADRVVGVNEPVLFDGTGSRDDDGVIVSHVWDFGDGNTASGAHVRHRFQQSGRYPVTLRVRDNTAVANSHATDMLFVTVNAPPVPHIQAPDHACARIPILFSGSESVDPDGRIMAAHWRFGDGAEAEGLEVTHTYDKPGRYQVTLTVVDDAGVINSRRQQSRGMHVNQPPIADAGMDLRVCPGQTFVLDGSRSTDSDGEIATYLWDLGNGRRLEGKKVSHAFAEPGHYPVRLTVTDDTGTPCGSGMDRLNIHVNAPPVAVAGGDQTGFSGGAHDALFFDGTASSDADGESLQYQWNFGDGNSAVGAKVYHHFRQAGTYTVRLTVRDESGSACGEAADEVQVIIKARK
jgi:large repetitive protein